MRYSIVFIKVILMMFTGSVGFNSQLSSSLQMGYASVNVIIEKITTSFQDLIPCYHTPFCLIIHNIIFIINMIQA